MDLGLSEEQEMLRNFARDFLEKECPEQHVRAMEDDPRGYSPKLWQTMAEQGWQGLIVPEAYGGIGMAFLDLVVLVEEFGRALVPGPFLPSVVGGAIAILEAGSEAQKQQWLPAIASGESIWTLALTEATARFDAGGVKLEAKPDGDSIVLNGTKLFVRDSQVADYLTVVARTPGSSGEDGISLVAVDAKTPGISQTPLVTMAGDKQNEVRFENVRVPTANVLGEPGKAWPAVERIALKGAVIECAYLVGLAQMDFEISVNYAKERVQFGRPIGSFQAIQHKAADMITDVDGARFLTYRAAWAVGADEPDAATQVHMAKAWTGESSRRVVAQGQQIHGGIGFTRDYKIQLFFRRQKSAELAWGDPDFHRELVAQSMGI